MGTATRLTKWKSEQVGWRIQAWGKAVGVGRSSTYRLLDEGRIQSVKLGPIRIITTPPADFLASLAEEQASKRAA